MTSKVDNIPLVGRLLHHGNTLSLLNPPGGVPGGGFEPGDGWVSSQGFDAVMFHEGTQSIICKEGGTCFWQDFANPIDLTTFMGFVIWSRWDPVPGFWDGFLRAQMTDTDFNVANIASWKKENFYKNQVPLSPTFEAWGSGLWLLGEPTNVDFSKIFSIGFAVGPSAGGPGFSGDPRIDEMTMITYTPGKYMSLGKVINRAKKGIA